MADKTQHSLLSDLAIKRAMKRGDIVIEPFNPSNLATTSYDVTLGPYFFRETNPEPGHGTLQGPF
jgi:deoxycytidine triphosphate deaminase